MTINEKIIKELIKNKVKTLSDLAVIKRKMAKKYKISSLANIELLKAYHNLIRSKTPSAGSGQGIKKSEILENLLRKRKIRSLSGIVAVSVLTKPYPCPGKCIYCPTEKGLPKSYLSGEPAVERAKRNKFDPYLQTKDRLNSLIIQGHPIDKIELRVIGGSFTAYPRKYQEYFIKECFRAANGFEILKNPKSEILISNQIPKPKSQTLEKEQKRNEKAKHRIVGISIETRPDLINKEEILHLRKLGVTMVELGVQTIYDDILKKCQRGHGIKETIKATKILKNAGFKVMYQIMPNLPGSDLKKDFSMAKEIFINADFRPDWLKIYPCLVCYNSQLYQLWRENKYQPYTDKELIKLLIKIKEILPYWVRLARLFRDIPSEKIEVGSKLSNIRQVVQKEMEKQGKFCHCIRCREIREKYNPKEKVFLFRQDYQASQGKEIFLSFENKKRTKLFSLLRLRIFNKTAFIRELQTFGQMIPLAEKFLEVYHHTKNFGVGVQHKGLGKKLIKEAEKITEKEFKIKKISVISGIGVRDYYRQLGYRLKQTYMLKSFKGR